MTMHVLVVKMSSLGDVVHTLPAVTDAATALGPDVAFDWVVEEAFASIPRRHRAVREVIPVAWRRWRRDLKASTAEMRSFLALLRRRRYDLVVDAQGLLKSAAVTALARGRVKAGLARVSAREGAASLFYGRQVAVPRDRHAIDRLRDLFAVALGYPRPAGPPDYGLAPVAAGARGRCCVLLHGTTWASKHWPVRFWRDLAGRATDAGFEVVVPWGNDEEHVRAGEIAAGGRARVLERLPLAELTETLAGAALVVGVDSGLAHLAAAVDVPTVVIYGSTSSALTGCRGSRVRNLQAEFPCAPCLSRVCRYRGPTQVSNGGAVEPACYVSVTPEAVWQAAVEVLEGRSPGMIATGRW